MIRNLVMQDVMCGNILKPVPEYIAELLSLLLQSLCANHGMCIGGQCECSGVWTGPTCEDCPV